MKKLILGPLAVLLAACATARQPAPQPDFTAWMNPAEFRAFLDEKDAKDEAGKNFWDHRKWVEDLEGRLNDGVIEYRLKIADAPTGGYWWYWYFGVSGSFVAQRTAELWADGFVLASCRYFVKSSGEKSYQVVFHKIPEPRKD
jgi:hypothetical protein